MTYNLKRLGCFCGISYHWSMMLVRREPIVAIAIDKMFALEAKTVKFSFYCAKYLIQHRSYQS